MAYSGVSLFTHSFMFLAREFCRELIMEPAIYESRDRTSSLVGTPVKEIIL